jgi:proteasome lid subunit RPN8/RPN11
VLWRSASPDIRPTEFRSLVSGLTLTDVVDLSTTLAKRPAIYLTKGAMDFVHAHVSAYREESGGLLIGYACVSQDLGAALNPVLVVTEAVPSSDFSGSSVSLRMNPGVWRDSLTGKPKGSMVVGWFHSHPNLGAFFSGTDRKTQREFFNHEYSLGLVTDYVRNEQAFFLGRDSVEVRPESVQRCDDGCGIVSAFREASANS